MADRPAFPPGRRGSPGHGLERLDTDRRRQRAEVIAEVSHSQALRDRIAGRRAAALRLRSVIAARRNNR